MPAYPPIVSDDDGTNIASSLVVSGSMATRYAVTAMRPYYCGPRLAGNIILVGRGLNVMS